MQKGISTIRKVKGEMCKRIFRIHQNFAIYSRGVFARLPGQAVITDVKGDLFLGDGQNEGTALHIQAFQSGRR